MDKDKPTMTRVTECFSIPLPPPGPRLKRKPQPLPPPETEDPILELRRLTRQHIGWTRKKVAMLSMVRDRTNHETGEPILANVPDEVKEDVELAGKTWDGALKLLAREMRRELKKSAIYNVWLKNVFGLQNSAVIAAYIICEINIHVATKISNLRRYCGLAVIDGRLERGKRGEKNRFNKSLRTRLFQFFSAMRKNAAKTGSTCKYLKVWDDYKHRMQHSARVDFEANTMDGKKGAKAKIDSTGWHKAADVFLEDLYIVWRSLEGLPVWPSYQAAKLGYEHGGKICVNEPRMLTVAQALELVGDVGAIRP